MPAAEKFSLFGFFADFADRDAVFIPTE